ncbi:hypothetical protein V2J09_023175 [Rumex salicifolius]
MKDFAGTPGTITGLALRVSQCIFASAAIAFMVSTSGFYYLTAFCYLVASMGLQATWSLGMALLDTYSLITKRALRSPVLISLFVVGDWVTGTLSLSAVSACAGIVVLYVHDAGVCKGESECTKFQFSVVLAFLSWVMIQTSSLIMFWLLASSV